MANSKKVLLDTPNPGALIQLVKEAYRECTKPDRISDINVIGDDHNFPDAWNGFYIYRENDGGEHLWMGIFWDKPRLLRFCFNPKLYDWDRVGGSKLDDWDAWPYVALELTDDFFKKTRTGQKIALKDFVNGVLGDLASAKVRPPTRKG